jgi:hypothetical protein
MALLRSKRCDLGISKVQTCLESLVDQLASLFGQSNYYTTTIIRVSFTLYEPALFQAIDPVGHSAAA